MHLLQDIASTGGCILQRYEVNTVHHRSFEAEKFRGKLYTQTFAKKTFAESLILSLKSILEQRHLELSYKKVSRTCEKVQRLQNFSALKLSWRTVYFSYIVL